jgi:glycosyltransferase involved in cell wall biosynthesis
MDRHGIEYTTSPDLDADVLHINNMGPRSVYHARRARRRGVPVLVHTHQTVNDIRDSFAFSNLLAAPMRPYLRYAYGLADHLVCPSEYNRREVHALVDVDATVISNGFDAAKLDGFEALRGEYLDRYDLDPPVVFTVGHVMERKGLGDFIETARAMPDLDFAWFGYVNPLGGGLAGRLLERGSVRRRIEAAPENCTFTGYVEDIRGAFAAGDVYLFPTKAENQGIAVLEAMACGKAVVLSDIPVFREYYEDGHDCLICEDEAEFREALERLAENPDLRERLGENAKETAREHSLDRVGRRLVETYEELA